MSSTAAAYLYLFKHGRGYKCFDTQSKSNIVDFVQEYMGASDFKSAADKTYGFCMEGRSNRIYEFEAPIDAMSHATLCKLHCINWREDHRVSEGL